MSLNKEIEFLQSLSLSGLSNWLLIFLSNQKTENVAVNPSIHPSVQIQRLFDTAKEDLRILFKDALFLCLCEWRLHSHGWDLLRNLSLTAAYIRAHRTANALASIAIRTQLHHENLGVPFDCADVVVGTLSGFVPGKMNRAVLENLFYDPGLNPRLAGHLLQGLCECSPEDFPTYFSHYRSLELRVPGFFAERLIIRLLLKVVPPPTLVGVWEKLREEDKADLLTRLSRLKNSNIGIVITKEGPTIYWRQERGETSSFTLPLSKKGEVNQLANLYQNSSKENLGDIKQYIDELVEIT